MVKQVCSLVLFSVLLLARAQATVLAPGGSVVAGPGDWSGPISADTGPEAFNFGLPASSGTVREIVVADSLNPFGAGDLTFVYQVTVTGGDIARVSGSDFGLFLTDVVQGVPHSPFVAGTAPSSSADRDITGAVVGFNFMPKLIPDGGPPANSSLDLIIRTNAKSFTSGSIGLIDGGGTTMSGFAPSTVPEPAFYGLLLLGMSGLFTITFRSKKSVS
jgi:hypothetical protein